MRSKGRILLIDDEEAIRLSLTSYLQAKGYITHSAENGNVGLNLATTLSPDLVLLDMKLPDIDGIQVLREIKALNPFIVVILLTAFGTIEKAVQSLKYGADNFLTKPFDPESLLIVIEHALNIHNLRKQEALNELSRKTEDEKFFSGGSTKMLKVESIANIISKDPSITVLITGPTGSGKGLWARWIHAHSDRSSRPLVELNCAGLSKELLESELFGYEKGAFTGATASKPGLMEIANGGTLFLDEISEMEPAVQAKMLKVLEDRKYRRLGAVQERSTDIRLVVATNKDLHKELEAGRFREDLYYRLNVMPLSIPALSERQDDIVPLAEFFLRQLAREKSDKPAILTDEARKIMQSYHWPGNLRELRNLMERAVLLAQNHTITPDLLPISRITPSQQPSLADGNFIPLRDMELRYIRQVLASVDNNYTRAAHILGVNRNTLYNRLKIKEA